MGKLDQEQTSICRSFAQHETPERLLAAVAAALGARDVPLLADRELQLLQASVPVPDGLLDEIAASIRGGGDPLGDAFAWLRSAAQRREQGATYTPAPIVEAMVDHCLAPGEPARAVDPGVGSARFLSAVARRTSRCALVGVELDPLAALIARANLCTAGFARRAEIHLQDYRFWRPDPCDGPTLFVGNPPYVRHHGLSAESKRWFKETAAEFSLSASELAGLHVHFMLATALFARPGDRGCFITSAEWLDVNYGRLPRRLLLDVLGVQRIDIIEPTAEPFPGTATTGVIVCFHVGSKPSHIAVARGERPLLAAGSGEAKRVARSRLAASSRWSQLSRATRRRPAGHIELGELCRVHRGQVTGDNKFWIAGGHTAMLPPSVLYPSITRARELFATQPVLRGADGLQSVVDLPVDLDVFASDDRQAIEEFLKQGLKRGTDSGYIASKRRAWWSVGLREPAPILATYMARRPPAFVHNRAAVRHLNIAHGLYPRVPLSKRVIRKLTDYLNGQTELSDGRTYAGGLTKFEPREMERLSIPDLPMLER